MTARVQHNITSGILLCLIAVPVCFLTASSRVNTLVEEERQQAAAIAPFKARQEFLRDEAMIAAAGSDIPLLLVKGGKCVPVQLVSNNGVPELLPNTVIKPKTPNGEPIPPGVDICTRSGKSGRITEFGSVADIQHTPIENMDEFHQAFDEMLLAKGYQLQRQSEAK